MSSSAERPPAASPASAGLPSSGTVMRVTAPMGVSSRVTSIDALRGLVVFTMIFVNDLAGAPERIVPAWMRHYHGASGMTFVDLVFPAFLFVVGMSIPLALGGRLDKNKSYAPAIWHVTARTLSLLLLGILMVNGRPDSTQMGWSGPAWAVLMYLSAILAFQSLALPGIARGDQRNRVRAGISLALRASGFAALIFLAFAYRGERGHRIVTLSPFLISVKWYGILGLIGWAYLVAALLFLLFRGQRTALASCMALLFCLFPAERAGFFNGFWPARLVGFGTTLGSQAAITLGGVLLASILTAPDLATKRARVQFTFLFVLACSLAALLLTPVYGINKNAATPSWCLWACAITATLWLGFYLLTDIGPHHSTNRLIRALALAGGNVLLAYLLSEMFPSLLDLLHLSDTYYRLAQGSLGAAVARSAGCAVILLLISTLLNRTGFRLRL